MLTIELKVNGRKVKEFTAINIHPQSLTEEFPGECPYIIFEDRPPSVQDGEEIGFVTHIRKDGITKLSALVLEKVLEHEAKK